MKKPSTTQKILQHLAGSDTVQSCTQIAAAIGELNFEKNVAALISNLKARRLVVAPERGGYLITELGRMHLEGIREDAAGFAKVASTARNEIVDDEVHAQFTPATQHGGDNRKALDVAVDAAGQLLVIAADKVARRLSPTESATVASLVLSLQKRVA